MNINVDITQFDSTDVSKTGHVVIEATVYISKLLIPCLQAMIPDLLIEGSNNTGRWVKGWASMENVEGLARQIRSGNQLLTVNDEQLRILYEMFEELARDLHDGGESYGSSIKESFLSNELYHDLKATVDSAHIEPLN